MMFYYNLPEGWRKVISDYLGGREPNAYDFDQHSIVSILLQDGSHMVFHHAFVVRSKEHAIPGFCVCTEHCGYHIFADDWVEQVIDSNNSNKTSR